jgi:membrane fusion protein, copper/silver efflux system
MNMQQNAGPAHRTWPWVIILLLAVACVVAGFWFRESHSKPASAQAAAQLYTCGMHPQVIQDHPGNCPICGMKLTPIRNQAGGQTITLDDATTQNMNIRTAAVTRGPLRRTIRTVGTIDYNETTLADVTTKFSGWIEKLYVDTTGQQVHRGDPLFEIYSPDIYSSQVEYLMAMGPGTNTAPGTGNMQKSARARLAFFDISDDQIVELERSRQAKKTLRINAPRDGYVIEKMATEGQMVAPGMKIYRIADLGLVWVLAQIYEQDLAYIKLGQEARVTLSYLPDRQFNGRLTYIYPDVDEKTRTAKVRMEFHNPGFLLKPGMFATVQLDSELEPSVLLVPDMAILRSGEKNIVFVALDGGRFEPRNVVLGPQGENDMYQVISGLKEGEKIVTSGQFMLDSESQLREAIQKMVGTKSAAAGSVPARIDTSVVPSAGTAEATFVCPMPEHLSIEYNHPGKCPICGMALVPVSTDTLHKMQSDSKLLYYTCPMPEHAQVHADKPGKCPICGMTLVPVMSAPVAGSSVTNQPASGIEETRSSK